MTGDEQADLLLYKIIQGQSEIEILDYEAYCIQKLYIREPNISDKIKAASVYKSRFDAALSLGVAQEDEIIEKLISVNLWSKAEQEHLDSIPDKIEDVKVQLYLAYKGFRSRDPIRKNLSKLNWEFESLYKKRTILMEQSCEGFAEMCKTRYIICLNTFYENGEKVFLNYDDADNHLVSQVVLAYLSQVTSDSTIRRMSKKDIWRSFWGPSKTERGVFNKAAIELTADQRSLISWSKIYDSINESPDCPADAVLEDDDMLDGWLIYQNRKRAKERANKLDSGQGANVKGDEVFLFADNKDDAMRIHDLNDSQGKANIRSLDKQMDAKDENGKGLKIEKTIEAQLEMRQMSNEQFKQKSRG